VTKTVVSLDDKFEQTTGRVFLSSIQALTRLPVDQARRDRAAAMSTAGFICGYRGSPIGTYDAALWSSQKLLSQHGIRFQPGLNEELAATAVRGTQELAWFGAARVEGIFSLWYGKGLGADRAAEALKLGNLEGAAEKGGVLAVVGDDHGGKSSVSSHQSEQVLMAAMLPILYPAGAAEILEFGLFGWALSRFSGAYVAMKCVTETLDLTSVVDLPDARRAYVLPDDFTPPAGGLNLRRAMTQLAQEDLLVNGRLPAAQAFVRANGFDRLVFDSPRPLLVIISAGKAYLDTRQALNDLGLNEQKCRSVGIRLYKLGLTWPLDPVRSRQVVAGATEVLVVEEKRPVIQDQLATLLIGMPQTPRLVGKRDPEGAVLLANTGELSPTLIRSALVRRLRALSLADLDIEERHAYLELLTGRSASSAGAGPTPIRPPFFCSGCPHNTSTKVPEGSTAMGATGCHALPAYLPGSATMRPMSMGAEGLPWVGVEHLVEMPHVFQNMGDGTYAHSGLLAIRAAVAAGATMTYKILYNDAVAMTGGQPVEGSPSPYSIVEQLLAEGVKPVAVVYDPAESFEPARLPRGVKRHERTQLDRVQREFREYKGVSAIVYVQTCAAEKRRRRKRGKFPDPDKRVFINPAVCEGCGDCSIQSNCISIQPLETELGRKRSIDQSTCNKDFSCVKGFCPSFVTIEGGTPVRTVRLDSDLENGLATLPLPTVANFEDRSYNVLVTGIGGTGVLTVGAILGMAAHIEGRGCTVLDMTGMAQKGGAVTSHIRIAPRTDQIFNARLDAGMSDVLIGCDLVVAAGADVLKLVQHGRTRAVINSDVAATGEFVRNRMLDLDSTRLQSVVREALGSSELRALPATRLATDLTGNSIATNLLMLGFSAQAGLLPVSAGALEQAIRLNGVAVDANLRAFALGRLAAAKPELMLSPGDQPSPQVSGDLDGIISSRVRLLTSYQDSAYAARYVEFMGDIRARAASRVAGHEIFLRKVASTLAQLMSYKDEYEVARLHADAAFSSELRSRFAGKLKVRYHLAPPLISRLDPATARPRKITFGPWIAGLFAVLQRFKFLRGTRFDPFGYSSDRRMEREQIQAYRQLILSIVDRLDEHNLEAATALAAAAAEIRGYGPVKEAAARDYAARLPQLLQQFEQAGKAQPQVQIPERRTA
jgi:indolepyruvate ferredoxin oxidoreductase